MIHPPLSLSIIVQSPTGAGSGPPGLLSGGGGISGLGPGRTLGGGGIGGGIGSTGMLGNCELDQKSIR